MTRVAKINTCGHPERPHSARGMCLECYHAYYFQNHREHARVAAAQRRADGYHRQNLRRGLARPDSQAGQLQRKLLALIKGPKHEQSGAIPTSLRFLLYELEQAGVVDKSQSDAISNASMVLRESGLIPWEWIVDETRHLTQWSSAPTIQQYILDRLENAVLDPWFMGEQYAPLILTESRSLAGVLERIAREYLCPIASTNGQAGGFLHTDIIPLLTEGATVLYFGDHDNAGHQIEANTREVIEEEVGELDWERVALTQEQVDEAGIEPITKYDKRTKQRSLAWETEALSQQVIQQMLEDRLTELLPEDLESTHARAQEERAAMRAKLLS